MNDPREPLRIGNFALRFVPHALPVIGPRIFLVLDEPSVHEALNLSVADARLIADRLKIAACEAEALARHQTNTGQKARRMD